jgi:GT2 family glycosyltransferase
MAYHAEVLRKYGLFRTDLGRIGHRLLSGEDTEMFARLRNAGEPIYYASNAVVHHPVEARRLTLGYLIRWKFWANYGEARVQSRATKRALGGVPLYIFRDLASDLVAMALAGLRLNWPAWAYRLGGVCGKVGLVCGHWFGQPKSGPSCEGSQGQAGFSA